MNVIGNQKAFSLIEVIVVLTLMALAATFIGGQVFSRLSEGRQRAAKVQIASFKQQLADYRRLCYSYPTTEQGLQSLVSKPEGGQDCKSYPEGGFMEKLPNDPWDRPYDYELLEGGKTFRIRSYGNDGVEGGTGEDQDISTDDA